jgi:hypothetical protein
MSARPLVVDAANVVGSRPDGWWKDRPGAAARLVASIGVAVGAGRLSTVVVVLEGEARRGVPEGVDGGVSVVHATGEGDDRITDEAQRLVAPVVVTADRDLAARARAVGAEVAGPRWLWSQLAGPLPDQAHAGDKGAGREVTPSAPRAMGRGGASAGRDDEDGAGRGAG